MFLNNLSLNFSYTVLVSIMSIISVNTSICYKVNSISTA